MIASAVPETANDLIGRVVAFDQHRVRLTVHVRQVVLLIALFWLVDIRSM
jgi:hypothetical protein